MAGRVEYLAFSGRVQNVRNPLNHGRRIYVGLSFHRIELSLPQDYGRK
jgi:hypothetical protein